MQPSAPIIDTMDHRRAHHRPLPRVNGAIPRSPTSLALARGNFSFVHETAWSTAVHLMSLGSVVTRRPRCTDSLGANASPSSYVINGDAQIVAIRDSPSESGDSRSRAHARAGPLNSRQRHRRARGKRVYVRNRKSQP